MKSFVKHLGRTDGPATAVIFGVDEHRRRRSATALATQLLAGGSLTFVSVYIRDSVIGCGSSQDVEPPAYRRNSWPPGHSLSRLGLSNPILPSTPLRQPRYI
jgi:hypothetical protein